MAYQVERSMRLWEGFSYKLFLKIETLTRAGPQDLATAIISFNFLKNLEEQEVSSFYRCENKAEILGQRDVVLRASHSLLIILFIVFQQMSVCVWI